MSTASVQGGRAAQRRPPARGPESPGPAAEEALAWLREGCRHLEGPRASAEAELRRLKAVCELSFVLALLPDEDLPEAVRGLRESVAGPLRAAGADGAFLKALWHQPQHANLYLPLLYALGRGGALDAAARADLALLCRRLRRLRKERLPFRSLDFLYSLHLLTGEETFRAALPATAEAGCLGPETDLESFADGDEYALTHGVFYLTGFGVWPWPFGGSARARLLALLQALAIEAEAVANWDLYAEYRIAETLLRGEDQGAAEAGDEAGSEAGGEAEQVPAAPLLAARRADGSWPGPAELEPKLRGEGFGERAELRFFRDYHTTLVAWMALALPGLRPDPRPLTPAPEKAAPEKAAPEKTAPEKTAIEIAVRYPGLPPAWTGLPGRFDALLREAAPAPPEVSLSGDPQGVLPWLEWWHWRRRLDLALPPPLPPEAASGEALLQAAEAGAWRLLRCRLLGAGAPESTPPELGGRLRRAVAETPAGGLLEAEALDRLVALALLGERGADFAAALARSLLLALRRRDLFAPGPLLAFAGERLPPALRRQAGRFLEEAVSASLPYGFVDGAGPEAQRRCLAAECYRPQAALAARLEGWAEGGPL